MEGFKMVTIKKATQAQTIAAIKSGDFSTVDTINRKAEKEAMEIFKAVAGGVIKLAYWDMSPVKRRDGKKSVMRYALHRSTKKRTVCNSPVWSLSAARSSPQVTNNLKLMMITTAGNFSAVFRALQK